MVVKARQVQRKARRKKKTNLKVLPFKSWPTKLNEYQHSSCMARIRELRNDVKSGRVIGFAYVSIAGPPGTGTYTGWCGAVSDELHRSIAGTNLLLSRLIEEIQGYSVPVEEEEE